MSLSKFLDWRDSLFALGLATLDAVFIYSLLILHPTLGTRNSSWILNWSGHLWFLAVPLVWYFGLRRRFPIGKVNAKMTIGWLPVWIILLLAAVPADIFSSQSTSLAGINSLTITMSILFNGILVGVSEEFLFRGQIQTGLNNSIKSTVHIGRVNLRLGTILATVAFAGFHFANLPNLLFALIFGLLIGHAYDRTSNLWGAIIIHNTVDFLGYIIPILL